MLAIVSVFTPYPYTNVNGGVPDEVLIIISVVLPSSHKEPPPLIVPEGSG